MDDLPLRLDFDDLERHSFEVDSAAAGARLDRYLALQLPDSSRAALKRLIQRGLVRLNDKPTKASVKVTVGDAVTVDVPAVLPPGVVPQDLPLTVLLEEDEFVVIDKAPGIAVHPGRGRADGTIANAIAFRYGEITGAGGTHRPGIVHRLDLETSGVMVIARTERAHAVLAEAFAERKVEKEYRALVHGEPEYDEEIIDLPLGRDVHHPTVMAVRFDEGREAQTRVEVVERLGVAAHVRCLPRTGRTHQIRVHLKSRGHPLLGDRMYARGKRNPVEVPRLMLHARRLGFPHPKSGAPIVVEAPLPADFERALAALRAQFGA
ncbi:MAG: RluA family pseudouridine synthase [Planctomycetota bacterium]|jgi:23S rRNA pseudouridine1911/1915/1917 synthase